MDNLLYVVLLQPFMTAIITIINNIFAELRKNIPSPFEIYNRWHGYVTYTLQLEEYYDIKTFRWVPSYAGINYINYVTEYLRKHPVIGDAELLNHGADIPFKMSKKWLQINNIYFHVKIDITTNKEEDKIKTIKILICAKSSNKQTANEILDEFLSMCKQQWEDDRAINRKVLVRNTPIANEKEASYRSYDFISKITFDNLYFPGKQTIIDAINKLNAGELSKLSILLSGIPGCGKTSIAKAIANYTGRCIIAVNMRYIKNTTELHALFFDGRIGDYRIKNKNRIYFLEEIDTLGKLVEKRDSDNISTSSNSASNESSLIHDLACLNTIINKDNKKDNSFSDFIGTTQNTLTLGDMLTTFDGIIELTGAIIIMTTNHKKLIDEALIRSGRIQIDCVLNACTSADAASIIKSYYPEYNTINIADNVITPSDLATACQISTNEDDLRARIKQIIDDKNHN